MHNVNTPIEDKDYENKLTLSRDVTWREVIMAGLFLLNFSRIRKMSYKEITVKLIEKFPLKV